MVETMTHFASPVHVPKTLITIGQFCFFVLQIWTGCPVFIKIEMILFFGSEKLKKCTNNFYHHDFPNYANFEAFNYLARFVQYQAH